jgi:hypothetical protein
MDIHIKKLHDFDILTYGSFYLNLVLKNIRKPKKNLLTKVDILYRVREDSKNLKEVRRDE